MRRDNDIKLTVHRSVIVKGQVQESAVLAGGNLECK